MRSGLTEEIKAMSKKVSDALKTFMASGASQMEFPWGKITEDGTGIHININT